MSKYGSGSSIQVLLRAVHIKTVVGCNLFLVIEKLEEVSIEEGIKEI